MKNKEEIEFEENYNEAVRLIIRTRKTSISYIQSRLKIGYNLAANIIAEMEADGIIGQLKVNGSREIYIVNKRNKK